MANSYDSTEIRNKGEVWELLFILWKGYELAIQVETESTYGLCGKEGLSLLPPYSRRIVKALNDNEWVNNLDLEELENSSEIFCRLSERGKSLMNEIYGNVKKRLRKINISEQEFSKVGNQIFKEKIQINFHE